MKNYQASIENDYAEALCLFKEVESSLIVLQQAIQSDEGQVTFANVDDNLELINERLSKGICKFAETYDKQFASIPINLKNQTSVAEELPESLTI